MKLRERHDDHGAHYAWAYWCPGCNSAHQFDERWGFDGNMAAPTVTGSVLVLAVTHGTPEAPIKRPRCHAILTAGRLFFCPDSEHALAGQTVDLPDWDDARKARP